MSGNKISNQNLKVSGMWKGNTNRIKNNIVLTDEIQELKIKNRELVAKNKRLIQILTDVTKGIKADEDDIE